MQYTLLTNLVTVVAVVAAEGRWDDGTDCNESHGLQENKYLQNKSRFFAQNFDFGQVGRGFVKTLTMTPQPWSRESTICTQAMSRDLSG